MHTNLDFRGSFGRDKGLDIQDDACWTVLASQKGKKSHGKINKRAEVDADFIMELVKVDGVWLA